MPEKHNGWASYETWLVNLWFDDYLTNRFEDNDEPIDGDEVKEAIEEYIDEIVTDKTGFVGDLINSGLGEVDWDELADHLNQDLGFVDEDDDDEDED